jgi:hypothetical protein
VSNRGLPRASPTRVRQLFLFGVDGTSLAAHRRGKPRVDSVGGDFVVEISGDAENAAASGCR